MDEQPTIVSGVKATFYIGCIFLFEKDFKHPAAVAAVLTNVY